MTTCFLRRRRRGRVGSSEHYIRSWDGRNGCEVNHEIRVEDVTFRGAGRADVEKGLLGWTSFTVNAALRLDGIAVRRTLHGTYALSFPGRQVRGGRRHFWVRPLTDGARLEIEHQVISAIGLAAEVRR